MYCFVTLVATFCKQPKYGLSALRVMVCGVYFWAGFHKLNMTFFTKIMPWVLSSIYIPQLDWLFKVVTYLTPIVESSIGILLLFRGSRFIATMMAFVMMLIVFASLGPFGHSWGKVIPLWNVWLFLILVLRLFLSPIQSEDHSPYLFKFAPIVLLSVMMFVIAPIAAMFVPGYARLGFKMFAGNTLTAQIILAPDETFSKRPALFKGLVKKNNRLAFKIPIYHSEYAYRKRGQAISPYLDNPREAKLRVHSPPRFYSTEREYTEEALG